MLCSSWMPAGYFAISLRIVAVTRRSVATQHRRREIGERCRLFYRTARACGRRQLDDQRHVQHFAIQQDSVLVLAVLPQTFAVIGREEDQRAIVDAGMFEKRQQLADELVRRLDLTVVRRHIRRVRLVEVDEEKERLRLVLADPSLRNRERRRAGTLMLGRAAARRCSAS